MDRDFIKKRILELDELCYSRDIIKYTDFLDLNEQSVYHTLRHDLRSPHHLLYGGHEDADRNMLIFLPDYMEEAVLLLADGKLSEASAYLPMISMIEVRPIDDRFADELSHRDFLGALMNLGIERSKTGDILTDGTRAYILVISDMADFICSELTRIKHTSVSCRMVPVDACDIRPEIAELRINVASERADAVLSSVFKLSREVSAKLIASGSVFVSGRELMKASCELREGDRISVRGYGKFIYKGVENTTKKGRLYVNIGKYV